MPRRGYKRQTVKNDPLYGSFEVSKLIRYAMKDGKKSVAEKHVYSAFEMIKSEKNDPVTVLEVAVNMYLYISTQKSGRRNYFK
jgi:small subunit ribosomal protein S7